MSSTETGEEILFNRALPKVKESMETFVELVNPPVQKLCTDALEALEMVMGKEKAKADKALEQSTAKEKPRAPGDKAVTLLTLLKVSSTISSDRKRHALGDLGNRGGRWWAVGSD